MSCALAITWLWCETISADYVRTNKYVSSSSRSRSFFKNSSLHSSVRRASPTPNVLPLLVTNSDAEQVKMLRLPLGPPSRSRLLVSRLAGVNGSKSAVGATRVFSSSIFDGDDDTGAGAGTSRDSAAVLRAMRNGEDVAAVTADDGQASVDSFRANTSPLDLWEETAARTEQERQRQNDAKSRNPVPSLSSIYDQDMDGRRMSPRKRGGHNGKKFISFFDEVDELIEKRRAEKIGTTRSKNGGAMGSSLANLLDKLDNYPDVGRLDDDRSSSVGYGHSSRLSDDFVGSNSISSKATSTFSHKYDDNLAPSANRARSIFDTDDDTDFEPEPVNPHAYDKETFEQYETLLREELKNQKFVQMRIRSMKDATEEEKQEYLCPVYKWLLTHERTVSYDLPTLRQASENPEAVFSTGGLDGQGGSQGDSFRGELEKQQQAFLEETGLTPEQYQVAEKAFQVLATQCAKRARAAPVEIMWEKVKESGMILSANVMSTILYVVSTGGSVLSASSSFSSRDNERRGSKLSSVSSLFSGISGRNDSAGVNKDNEEDEGTDKTEEDDSVNVQDEVAFFHDMLYEPTDNSTSLRVKGLISKGDAEGAEQLLEAFASREGTVVRLRSYLPILNLYCQKGEISSAMRLFKRMRNTESVHLEPENYVMVISALAENGCFREDAEPIENAAELGYSEPCGLALFDELVTEMAEDVLEITSASARKMYNALAVGFKDQHAGRNLQEMHSLAGMRVFNDPSEDDEVVASRISVDHETGMCPRTKAKLRLVMLDDGQRKQLRQSLSQLAASETAKFAKGNKRKQEEDAQRAIEEMTRFADWLE